MRIIASLVELFSLALILYILGVPNDKILIATILFAIPLGTLSWEIDHVVARELKKRDLY